tara:strand:- start:225 stop:812 length:588 start_codon:yes stop_codon:yes gene_type:complete
MSAYLCSDDTLNALSTYWFIKSGKTWDDPSKSSEYKRAMRIAYKDSYYKTRTDCKDPLRLYADFQHHIDEHFEKLLKNSHNDLYELVFNTLLRENKNSLNARYSNPTDMFRDSYIYRLSNCVVNWIENKQSGYLVGIVNNYDYQSCEHENHEKSLGYAILNQIKDYLLEDMKLGEIWDFNEQRFIAQMEAENVSL